MKIFRGIRESLLSDGKTVRYLKYAIGEIILVVIGILIAIAINNWKEGKSVANAEYRYMQNLKEDLQADIKLYDNYLLKNQGLYQIIDSLVVLLSQEDFRATSDESAFYGRIMTTRWKRVHPVERTFEQMKSSGQLKIIRNQTVSDLISDYYNSIYELETYNEALLIWLAGYIKLMGNVFDGQVLFEILKTNARVSTGNSAIITEDAKIINDLVSNAQYVYGAIKLSETVVVKRKEKAENLIKSIDRNYTMK